MKRVVYTCPFVPAEWIAAHGVRPSRIMPHAPEAGLSADVMAGVCTYTRAFLHGATTGCEADAVIVTTVCDQMRRVAERVERACDRPVFLINVPATWDTPTAQELYIDELKRLGRFLVRLGGTAPGIDELARVLMDYDARRASLRGARAWLSPREHAEAMAAFHRDGRLPDQAKGWAVETGVPLAVVGGPLTWEDLGIFDIVAAAGGRIVLDATETGERTLPAPLDRRRVRDEPLDELARMYFGTIPDAFRRPNAALYRWLKGELGERAVRGVIYWRCVWCDVWHGELSRFREWTDRPVLDLEGGDGPADHERARNRIEAFLEPLR